MPTSTTPSTENTRTAAPPVLPEGWIPVSERLPREDETLDGRVPALDEEGFLITALLLTDEHMMAPGGLEVRAWLPVQASAAAPGHAELERLRRAVANVAAAIRAKAINNPAEIKASTLDSLAAELEAALKP